MVSAEEATLTDLEAIRLRSPELADSALAAAALEMARGLDSTASLAQKSLAAKELKDLLARLLELAPPAEAKDRMDDLADRRAKRLAG